MARQLGDLKKLGEADIAIYSTARSAQQPIAQLELLRRVDDALDSSISAWSSTEFIAEGEALEEGGGITMSKDTDDTRITVAASGTNMLCIPIGTDPAGQTVSA